MHENVFFEKTLASDRCLKTKLAHDEKVKSCSKIFNESLSQNNHRERKIAPIVHQIWLGSPMPELYAYLAESWKNNSGLEYRLWTDKDIKDFEVTGFDLYRKIENWGLRSDLLRYEIIAKYGGVYTDTDSYCFKSFTDLLGHRFFTTFSFTQMYALSNTLFGSEQDHPFLWELMDTISNFTSDLEEYNSNKARYVMVKTGPEIFGETAYKYLNTDSFIIYPNTYFLTMPNDYKLFSSKLIYHLLKRILPPKRFIQVLNSVFRKEWSYAITYYDCSWGT